MDVKYVLVVFGSLVGYPGDDINKFIWMVRIGGGVFPYIKEPNGQYHIDAQAAPTMFLKELKLIFKAYHKVIQRAGGWTYLVK